MRILLITEKPKFARSLRAALKASTFAVDTTTGNQIQEAIKLAVYDGILLDMNHSLAEGVMMLQMLRKQNVTAPIIVFNGCESASERIRILEAGADDCLIDPLSITELVTRTRVVLRRPALPSHKIKVGELELDCARYRATRAGKQVSLTRKEFAILEYLMRNAGRPVSRSMIVEHVWDEGFQGLTNVVDVYINYLRSKIDRGFDKKLIRTAHGIGYELVGPGEEAA